jgi:pimeloyl-ACP methyl ester carboxylesterase
MLCAIFALLTWTALSAPRTGLRVGGALGVAALAIPVGIGIGGPHLVKAGFAAMTIAGLAILLGGLVILGAGIGWLVRATGPWTRIGALAAATLVQLVMTWTLGQAVAATNVPQRPLGSARPADYGLEYRDVSFAAADGVRLSGWYVPSHNHAAVVLLHGAGSTRTSVLPQAIVLARHGFGVLLYDGRGHGRSAGRAMNFGWYGDEDINGAVAFLMRQNGIDRRRIAAVGMSMGGEEAIGAAAANRRIRAVVAEGATNRVAADKAWLPDEFGMRGVASEWLEGLTYSFADLLTAAAPPVSLHDAVRAAAPRPVLLIAAGSVPDESRADRYVQSASPETVSVWVVPRTGHTAALETSPVEWESRVTGFLDRALGTGR